MVSLTNSMSGKKITLHSAQQVTLYVCGITPYDYAHIGHGRCYISFDILFRLLTFLGRNVLYCRNITDIDDKLLHKSHQLYGTSARYTEVATYFFNCYKQQMVLLNIKEPTVEPRVTEHIPDIIQFIEELIAQGHAYVADHDVYFAIDTYAHYGTLSGQKVEQLQAGARVEIRDAKKNPADFVLWKAEKEPFWNSPWGNGRPGWHIECSALAARYLGPYVDIHGGGLDLIFPHHENEKAQSESRFNQSFVGCWMHNGLVTVNHEKMSKSLGNFITLQDLFAQHEPMVVRYYFLTFHYKSPAEFLYEGLAIAKKNYDRIAQWAADVAEISADEVMVVAESSVIVRQMIDALGDDLNTPAFLGLLFEHIRSIKQGSTEHSAIVMLLKNVLGLTLVPLSVQELALDPEIEKLLQERNTARHERNWQKADALRLQLLKQGYVVKDEKL